MLSAYVNVVLCFYVAFSSYVIEFVYHHCMSDCMACLKQRAVCQLSMLQLLQICFYLCDALRQRRVCLSVCPSVRS